MANSDVTSIIKVTLLGGGMKEYSVNLSEFYCSCQYFLEHNLLCTHMAFAIWKTGKRVKDFIGGGWNRNLYVYAYVTPAVNHPFIVKDKFEYSTSHPPIITRRRGRPRTSRIESQAATLELCRATNKNGH